MRKKGQALTQALVTGFGVVILILLIVIINKNSIEYKHFVASSQLESTCLLIRSAIGEIQPLSGYSSVTETMLGSVVIDLPEKIGNSPYRTGFIDKNITIETLDEPKIYYSCSSGFNLKLLGASNGGPTELLFLRSSNGDRVEMRKK